MYAFSRKCKNISCNIISILKETGIIFCTLLFLFYFSMFVAKESEYISCRLYRRQDDEMGGTPLRSSSETSVFDFRESDSESEMPVLERQTLDEMRRDRRVQNRHGGLPTSQVILL